MNKLEASVVTFLKMEKALALPPLLGKELAKLSILKVPLLGGFLLW